MNVAEMSQKNHSIAKYLKNLKLIPPTGTFIPGDYVKNWKFHPEKTKQNFILFLRMYFQTVTSGTNDFGRAQDALME